MIDIIISILLLCGTFLALSGSIGILRFPDIYTRLHAATKSATLGVAGVLLGAFLFLYIENGIISGKLLLGIIFILITAPVSGHMISRAAHNTGVELWKHSIRDELKEEEEKAN
ncbi:monovalent cation/H(+) antiporter subunit G [Tenuibacillus multivorans]|uniref:Multicomponent Na+:H+ antiporter subunit G n=1 Tax=Tenuibacillus multivorans TaxID=237069 RepID=A0A1G9ZG95_9BACI|nr:monovalent cation/H(+) antiporter subunit G [Tenuibacillus multivorans]GEL77510.1 Na+/H+ antiporter subunit G [Tenuibacillus multivorans]SDN20462.1 multicomponent Na+:H+ antiporter subunit G [Tenuibacillus multivorans]